MSYLILSIFILLIGILGIILNRSNLIIMLIQKSKKIICDISTLTVPL